MPKFAGPITNVTVPVGREATLVCIVDDLGSYKVSQLTHDVLLKFSELKYEFKVYNSDLIFYFTFFKQHIYI